MFLGLGKSWVNWFKQLLLRLRNMSSCLRSIAQHWRNPHMTKLGQLLSLKQVGFGSFLHLVSCHSSNLVDALEPDVVAQANSGMTQVNFNGNSKISSNRILLLSYTAIIPLPCNDNNNCHYHAAYNNKFYCNCLLHWLPTICFIMQQCYCLLKEQLHSNPEIIISKHRPWESVFPFHILDFNMFFYLPIWLQKLPIKILLIHHLIS